MERLLDRPTTGLMDIDMIEFRGIEFRRVHNRLMALKLAHLARDQGQRSCNGPEAERDDVRRQDLVRSMDLDGKDG